MAVILQKHGQTNVWHLLRNRRHHPNVSRDALKVQGVRSIVADRYKNMTDITIQGQQLKGFVFNIEI